MGDASDHFFSNCRVDIRREVVRAIRAAVSVYKSLNYRIASAIPKKRAACVASVTPNSLQWCVPDYELAAERVARTEELPSRRRCKGAHGPLEGALGHVLHHCARQVNGQPTSSSLSTQYGYRVHSSVHERC